MNQYMVYHLTKVFIYINTTINPIEVKNNFAKIFSQNIRVY